MNKINIPFRGITNVPDDSYSQDGSMSVLLNMRHKGGELVPCRPPTVTYTAEGIKQAMYHAQSGYWLILYQTGSLQFENFNNNDGGELKLDQDITSFTIMGNVVVVNLKDSVEYAIWRNGIYVYLGGLPVVPRLIGVIEQEKTIERETSDSYYRGYNITNDIALFNQVVSKGYIDQVLDEVYEERGYVDRAWFKVALRLFDGSCVALSGIYQLSARRTGDDDVIGSRSVTWSHVEGTEDGEGDKIKYRYKAKVDYFVPSISLGHFLDAKKWKDIIVSIDVYSTGSIMTYAPQKRSSISDFSVPPYEVYAQRTPEELKEAMINADFHKVAEFDLNGNELWSIDNTSPSNIAVQEVLNDVQLNSVIAKDAVVINSKLHATGIKERFFRGFNAYRIDAESYNRSEKPWTIVVYLRIDNKEKRVVFKEDSETQLNPPLYFFAYPDSRAYRMEVYEEREEGGYKMLSLPLTPHRIRNEAYFLKTKTVTISGDRDSSGASAPEIDMDITWSSANSIPNADDVESLPGFLKVSEIDNPFYFPAAQTYKFEGDILRIASNAEAISTGQFGQYPLFVFTTEGIWAMQVDTSGKGAYATQSPFSREVCAGDGTVCPVSGGIVFTTQRGVMAISGGQVTELSARLDGLDNVMMKNSRDLLTKVLKNAGISYMTPENIRTYINDGNGAKLAYNYLHNEVILSNIEYPYSYVYSLDNREWSMIDKTFDVTTNKYPELVVFETENNKMLVFDDEGPGAVEVAAITRPIKVDTLDFKRLRQAALRCTFEGELNFYVLGSNDGARFVCITGKEYPSLNGGENTAVVRRDLITSMSRSKQYKYMAVAVSGRMNGRISLAEMLVEGGFASNQLR